MGNQLALNVKTVPAWDYDMMCPHTAYTISAVVDGKLTFESYNATPEETNKCINYYKDILPLYGFESSKAKLRLFIKREFNLTMGQSALFASDVLKLIQKM
jgi:hypothetical protein